MAALLDYVAPIVRLGLALFGVVLLLVFYTEQRIYRAVLYQNCLAMVPVCICVYCILFLLTVNMLLAI